MQLKSVFNNTALEGECSNVANVYYGVVLASISGRLIDVDILVNERKIAPTVQFRVCKFDLA